MKIFEHSNLKKPKTFLKGDLFIYPILLALVIVLFFALAFPKAQNSFDGFKCEVDGQTVFTYQFDSDKVEINGAKKELVKCENAEFGYLITIYSQLGVDRYNVIKIDVNNKTACVLESTCSNSKDCTHIPAIKNSGAIYCAPHKLKLSPLGNEFKDPITGGLWYEKKSYS